MLTAVARPEEARQSFALDRVIAAVSGLLCLLSPAALVLVANTAAACRYNVRDLGFVDRPDCWPSVQIRGDEGQVADFQSMLRKEFGAAKLQPKIETAPGNGDLEVVLSDSAGRTLSIGSLDEGVKQELAGKVVDRVRLTDFGQELISRLIDSPCLVLFVGDQEGKPSGHVDAAQAGVEAAIRESSLWAKPMDGVPAVVKLDRNRAERERVLLWSLGIDRFSEDEDTVAITYGRLRRIGPVMTGDAISADAIRAGISMLGRDCECDLPRSVFDGPGAIHAWDETLTNRARDRLGFDPLHPMTEIEVRQILNKQTRKDEPLSIADPFWGYHEIDLDEFTGDGPPSSTTTTENPTQDEEPSDNGVVQQPTSDLNQTILNGPPWWELLTCSAGIGLLSAVAGWLALRPTKPKRQ